MKATHVAKCRFVEAKIIDEHELESLKAKGINDAKLGDVVLLNEHDQIWLMPEKNFNRLYEPI